MRKTVKDGAHTAIAAVIAAYLVASVLTFCLGWFVPSSIQLTRPVTCPKGTLSMELGRFAMLGESPSRGLGVMCAQPGEPPVDVGDATFAVLATALAVPLGVFFYVSWRGPSRASIAWNRRWRR